MWSALLNGSGLHTGGGAARGNVPSQGWEFVPCTRLERTEKGKGKSHSPLRRISSPPTIFNHISEPQCDGLSGGGEDRTGTKLEFLKGQMSPVGPESQQQQQQQHTRLKKKFDGLKKQHVQDKEEWMREKESLLREVADIQGGENRRILLDLKTVLEEVQVEVKREEEKRSDLQLQYTRDRCAWELERVELKCRIAQLETKDGSKLDSGAVQCATGSYPTAQQVSREEHSETSTLQQDKEEQRRLLVDTHSTTMELRCRLEHNEKDWLKEKAELLERFDLERSEWESQLKDVQRKIEELYCEVRAKREGTGAKRDEEEMHRLSVRSLSSGSSLLSDMSQTHSSCSQPELSPPFDRYNNISGGGRESHSTTCCQPERLSEVISGGQFTLIECAHTGLRSRDSALDRKDAANTSARETVFHESVGRGLATNHASLVNEKNVHRGIQESPLVAEPSNASEKKKSTIALNAALKEIARVSEELCSYHDEIKKKSEDKRNHSELLHLSEEKTSANMDKTGLQLNETQYDLSHIYNQLKELEKENWITVSPDYPWRDNRGSEDSWENTSIDSCRDVQTWPVANFDIDTRAPPIPPRSFSRNLSTPSQSDTELHIPESPKTTIMTKCNSSSVTLDKNCSSPSIVRKFEAMLQENEGKIFIDGVITSCSVPKSSNCNMGCCHNRWSCDGSKFASSKMSRGGTVQKCFSEANILTSRKDCSPYSPVIGNLHNHQIKMPPVLKELPVDLLLSSLEISPISPNLQGSRRNIMLEKKTAEFNRTLFQAEMGRGVEEQQHVLDADGPLQSAMTADCAPDEPLPPKHCPDNTISLKDMNIEVPLSTSHLPLKKTEVTLNQISSEAQKARMKNCTSSLNATEPSNAAVCEASTVNSQSNGLFSEAERKVQTASISSRKTQNKASISTPLPGMVLSENNHPGQNVESILFKRDSHSGAVIQPAKVDISLQEPSAQSKQRPAPRMMNDHPWKPLTLAAYPRPEGSRSNYGALERILKHYETAAQPQDKTASGPNVNLLQDNAIESNMQDMTPHSVAPPLRQLSLIQSSTTLSSHSGLRVAQIQQQVQNEGDLSIFSTQNVFSKPACPANRRPPSRWANRSPTFSSFTTTSSCKTPV
ncbi:protein SOGA3a [Syngnathoides biaculeatus]|uniref:protein SOGA3a n=1 Tax=Syngnathoides biaculeatus TaxID=300417 RepID=UPI002ADE44D5|nr:protein SOGA3a [Syngnathoides biaculeatus]